MEADKAVARNAVEEYVYDMRDKLSEELMEFISEEVSVPWWWVDQGTSVTRPRGMGIWHSECSREGKCVHENS